MIAFVRASVLLASAALAGAAQSQQTISLTIASSHPVTQPWVAAMQTYVVPEMNKRLAADGNRYRIAWREAYGGILYKMNATLTSVQDGVTDIGWVFTALEPSRMPLGQVALYAPGVSGDYRQMQELFNELMETVPALKAEWDKSNAVFLGAVAPDQPQLFTRFQVNGLADLKGRKVSAAGTLANFLRGAGATAVDGSTTTFYNDIKTGVSEGAVVPATAALSVKLYEAANYVTKAGLGTYYAGALAINKDSYAKLPPAVQKTLREVGHGYSTRTADLIAKGEDAAYGAFKAAGNPPVKVTALSAEEQRRWILELPNIAQEWVKTNEAKGLPAGQVLKTYLDAARSRGMKPLRDWDKS